MVEDLSFEQDTILNYLKGNKKVKYFDKWVSYDLNEKQKLIQKIRQHVAEELSFEQDTILNYFKGNKKMKYFDKWVSCDLNEKQKLIWLETCSSLLL